MVYKTEAIVLRNTNYSESSVICKTYTKVHGIRSFLINGVRKPKAKISMSSLQPLNILQLEAYEKSSNNLQRIKELRCEPLLINISQDFRKRGVALFIIELLNACLWEEDGDESLFSFIKSEILALEKGSEVSNFSLYFMMRYAKVLGIEPHGNYSQDNPYFNLDTGSFHSHRDEHSIPADLSSLLDELKLDHENQGHLQMTAKQRRELLNSLILYFQFHIMKNREMKSLKVLTEVMEAWHTV